MTDSSGSNSSLDSSIDGISFTDDESTEENVSLQRKEGISSNKWKLLSVILLVIIVVLSILFAIFLTLYFIERRTGKSEIRYIRDEEYEGKYEEILSTMKPYSFSQNSEDGIVEGLLFLPNDDIEFSFSKNEPELTYSFFKVQNINDEEPVEWLCDGTCGEERRFAITLPSISFYLFSIASAAATSYYLSEIKRRRGEDCGVDSCEHCDVKCEIKEQYEDGDLFFYFCSGTTFFNKDASDQILEKDGVDMKEMWDDYTLERYCVVDTEDYDLAKASWMAKQYFKSVALKLNKSTKNSFEIDSDIVEKTKFNGCVKRNGIIQKGFYLRCDHDVLNADPGF